MNMNVIGVSRIVELCRKLDRLEVLCFSTLFVGMEHFVAFRLRAEPHAVTQGFVLLQMDRSIIFLYQVMH